MKIGHPKFTVYESRGGKWHWRLTALNGQIIAASASGYLRKQSAKDGIFSVVKVLTGERQRLKRQVEVQDSTGQSFVELV